MKKPDAHGTRGKHGRTDQMSKLVLETETDAIRGACFEVYKEKGCGFLEAACQECLEMELRFRGVPARSLVALPLSYKGVPLLKSHVADFICYEQAIVEVKAVSLLADEHRAQM